MSSTSPQGQTFAAPSIPGSPSGAIVQRRQSGIVTNGSSRQSFQSAGSQRVPRNSDASVNGPVSSLNSPATPGGKSLPHSSQGSGSSIRSIGHSFRSAFAARLRSTDPDSTIFKHRRDEIFDDPDFRWKTFNPNDDYYYDDAYRSLEQPDSVNTLECWDYEGTDDVDRDRYVRLLEAGDVRHFGPDDHDNPVDFDKRFDKWLKQEDPFDPIRPHGAGVLRGGLRMAMCDRPLMRPGMTIRKEMFSSIEQDFALHEATLPALLDNGGCFSTFAERDASGQLHRLRVVVKSVQKVEITNCLISLTYTVSNRWTDAFACGDGLILGNKVDDVYGDQLLQLLNACACGSKTLWTNPLHLPVALLQMCTRRALTRTKTLEKKLHQVESALGVVQAGWVIIKEERPNWPMDIDIKRQTRELHSTLPHILFLKGVVQWQKRYAAWLLETTTNLESESVFAHQKESFEELRSTVQLMASSVDGMLDFFEGMEGRTQSQINLLFSVVGQRDAINSQKANNLNFEVARSTKEDSISMTTFTFITALFLPPSFIATMFSMSGMFEWGADVPDGDETILSKRYWIFWAVAGPLTILTMIGWYAWYTFANMAWQRKIDRQSESYATAPQAEDERTADDREKERLEKIKRKTEAESRARPADGRGISHKETKSRVAGLKSRAPFKWVMAPRSMSNEKSDAV